jgi:hypothetical protein
MRLFRWKKAFVIPFLLAGLVPVCWAQFNSSVEGTVTDKTGAVVPNAHVTLHNVQTSIDLSATAESNGNYRFNAVGPGNYQVIVEAQGFAKRVTDVQVLQDEVAAANVTLTVGAATTEVNVTTVENQLNPDETRLEVTLDAQQVSNLPLQDGSVLETVRTAPGVTGIDEDRSMNQASIYGSVMYAQANGRPNSGNVYMLDGVSILSNTGYGGVTNQSITFVPTEDMVQEVSLETQSYSVDFGSSSSMKTNFTSKGGTNQFHGDFGDRYSGRGLNATGDFSSPELPNGRRWYTGSIGGPIWKDRSFFFFAFMHQTQATAVEELENWATNEFTGTWAPQNYPNSVNVNDLLVPFPVGNASSGGQKASVITQGVTDYASDLFATSTPNVCAVPIKNLPFYLGTQIGSTPIPCSLPVVDYGVFDQSPRVDGFEIDGRFDQYFRRGEDRLYADYVLEPQISDYIWWRPGFNTTTPGGARYLNFNYTHIFTPALVNQVSVSYLRFYNSYASSPANTIPFLTLTLGMGDSTTDYFGSVDAPSWQKNLNIQLHDDVTWIHGRHNLKAGFSGWKADYYDQAAGGSEKATTPEYFSWSDMLDDQPWSYDLATLSGSTGKYLANITGSTVLQIGAYAQDDWKVRPNLLITYGLRWEDYGNPAAWGANVLPYYNMVSPTTATIRENIVNDDISTMKAANAFASRQDLNFLPRVGFAWTPFPDRKITVHGGAGFYEDAMNVGGVVSGLETNSPSYLNLNFGYTNPAPLNVVNPRNYYGTDANSPPPFGDTFSYPSIVPVGHDSHGEVLLNENGINTVLTSALTGVDPHLKPQKTALYSVQVEGELSSNFIVGVGYSGSFSWGQYANGDYNSYPGDMIANNGIEKRLSPEWGSIGVNEGLLSDNYSALMLMARQTLGRRLSWHAGFIFSKSLGYGATMYSGAGNSDGGAASITSIPDIYDPKHYYGPLVGSVPVSFNGSASYELPGDHLRNFAERSVLGGWTFSTVTSWQSGSPFSLYTSAGFVPISEALPSQGGTCTPAPCGTDISNPSNAGEYLANGIADSLVNIPTGLQKKGFSRAQWKYGVFSSIGYSFASTPTYGVASSGPGFTNPSAYGVNPIYSNQGFNSFVGPGYLDLDGALHKKVFLPWFGNDKGSTLTLGIEGSNIINRVNLSGPASADLNNVSSHGLGVAQEAYQARIFQLVARFEF